LLLLKFQTSYLESASSLKLELTNVLIATNVTLLHFAGNVLSRQYYSDLNSARKKKKALLWINVSIAKTTSACRIARGGNR